MTYLGNDIKSRASVNNEEAAIRSMRNGKKTLMAKILDVHNDGDLLQDIASKLPKTGRTAVSTALKQLVERGVLRRLGTRGEYRYYRLQTPATAATTAIRSGGLPRTTRQEVQAMHREVTDAMEALGQQVDTLNKMFRRLQRIGEHVDDLKRRMENSDGEG